MAYKIIRPRHGIKSLWDTYKSRIYKLGEMLVESPESGVGSGPVNIKFGDGVTPYENLPYAVEAPISQLIEGSTKPITSGAVHNAISEQNKKRKELIKIIRVSKTITINSNSAINFNPFTEWNESVPDGYTVIGVVGFTTGRSFFVPIAVRYVDSEYGIQIKNVGTSSDTSEVFVYLLCVDLELNTSI